MFALTERAAALIQTLIHKADMHPGSGLRFSLEPACGALVMSLVARPVRADTVFTFGNARVFLAPSTVTRLDRQTLDAHVSERSRAFFLRDS